MNKDLIQKALISGLIWAVTYLYIRRYLNPENAGDITKYKMDALYGGLAAVVAAVLKAYLL